MAPPPLPRQERMTGGRFVGSRQPEFVVRFLISSEVCGEEEVGRGAEVLSEASQLRPAFINKSRHANCVCTQT